MAAFFAVRDLVVPPVRNLAEVGLRPGDVVLDFGCGPGSFTLAAADLVEPNGLVYALDLHPLALQSVRRRASKLGFKNLVRTVQSPLETGLGARSIDVVLLYDVFHMLTDRPAVLAELRRVLKPEGVLSVAFHHMRRQDGVREVTDSGCFRLLKEHRRTVSFRPLPG